MVLFRVDVPQGKLPIRCDDCKRLLTVERLNEGGCICGKRVMKTSSYLGLWERIRIRFFKLNPVWVGDCEMPSHVVAAQAKKM